MVSADSVFEQYVDDNLDPLPEEDSTPQRLSWSHFPNLSWDTVDTTPRT